MRWLRQYLVVIVLVIVFLLLQYEFWFSRGGVVSNHRLEKQLEQEKVLLEKQRVENKKLLQDVIKIKHDAQIIEAHARKDLGMVKRGEEYIEVAENPASK